jgi:hypothetical protein
MRFRYLNKRDGTPREKSCQFPFSSANRFLVSLLFPFANVLFAQPVDTTSIFPLNTGDWTEYVAYSKVYFDSFNPPINNSGPLTLVREVLGDTVMSNSLVYKVIRWKYMMNSIHTPQPWYQYLRKDAQNKIWGWGNNNDSLIYDFSQLRVGYSWQVGKTNPDGSYYSKTITSIYQTSLFDRTGYKYEIATWYYHPTPTYIGYEIFVEGFGAIRTQASFINCNDTTLVLLACWGAIIGKTKHGKMLAGIDNVLDFYPLNVGDSWHYRSNFNSYPDYSLIVSIKCDTVFSDGMHYKGTSKRVIQDYPPAGENTVTYYYQRIDSQGNVYSIRHDGKNWISQRDYRFSLALGDTFLATSAMDNPIYSRDFLTDKWQTTQPQDTFGNRIQFTKLESPVRFERFFSKDWGRVGFGGEGYSESLIGAHVHGKTWGDLRYLLEVESTPSPKAYTISISSYPNPFNNSTVVRIQVNRGGFTQLRVHNISGQLVAALYQGYLERGIHNISWTPQNLSSGIYVISLHTESEKVATKLLYLK